MSTADDDRIALDLLDAHLEDLWRAAGELQRGNRAIVPEVPLDLGGASADGAATELLRWGNGELAGIPRSPADVFARSAGTTIMELRRRRSPWNAAALRLLEDRYVFLATGPRRHEDWAEDMLALMHREVPDPRGWLRIDADRTKDARHAVPAYPFAPPPAARRPPPGSGTVCTSWSRRGPSPRSPSWRRSGETAVPSGTGRSATLCWPTHGSCWTATARMPNSGRTPGMQPGTRPGTSSGPASKGRGSTGS
ncbi:hypothetical protein ACODT5_22390 [Streptomyces sp. 5.8]|uniref:hypothetical protein n=1 Tax=Streptomyces sp. 5.8 TaxID=3406571 RepID=UPI003BB57D98